MSRPTVLTVNVLQHHIDEGTQNCSNSCPIAKSVWNEVQQFADEVYVDGECILIDWKDGTENMYVLPGYAREFVYAFDISREVSPLSFTAILDKEHEETNNLDYDLDPDYYPEY